MGDHIVKIKSSVRFPWWADLYWAHRNNFALKYIADSLLIKIYIKCCHKYVRLSGSTGSICQWPITILLIYPKFIDKSSQVVAVTIIVVLLCCGQTFRGIGGQRCVIGKCAFADIYTVCKGWLYGSGHELWLSCYLVLLSIDSKTK